MLGCLSLTFFVFHFRLCQVYFSFMPVLFQQIKKFTST